MPLGMGRTVLTADRTDRNDEEAAATAAAADALASPGTRREPSPLNQDEARAVLRALDPFWTRGIFIDESATDQPAQPQ